MFSLPVNRTVMRRGLIVSRLDGMSFCSDEEIRSNIVTFSESPSSPETSVVESTGENNNEMLRSDGPFICRVFCVHVFRFGFSRFVRELTPERMPTSVSILSRVL